MNYKKHILKHFLILVTKHGSPIGLIVSLHFHRGFGTVDV